MNLFSVDSIIVSGLSFSLAAILVSYLISILLKKVIGVFFYQVKGRMKGKFAAKTSTLRTLVNNIIDVFIFVIAIFMILSHWGVDIIPLLTGAGIVGLALSFGAQTLVKDIISGLFIIAENQYNVGDKVKIIDKYEGVVEQITLRLTVLKDKKGNYIYIPNSQITSVIRYATS